MNTRGNHAGKLNVLLVQDSAGKRSSDAKVGVNFPGEKEILRGKTANLEQVSEIATAVWQTDVGNPVRCEFQPQLSYLLLHLFIV